MNLGDFTRPAGSLVSTTFWERLSGRPFELRETAGSAFAPNPLPPTLIRAELLDSVFDELIAAEQALSQLQGSITRLSPHLLIGPFAQREARLSSAIENTFASAEQMVLFDVDPTSIEAESRDEVREVVNYRRALEYGLTAELPISLRLVRELHKRLLEGVERRAGTPGEFRTKQNAIGRDGDSFEQARFVPPPPRLLQDCLNSWESFNHAESNLPRIVRFALSHYQFECIHPFDDGNGRVGRLLIALQLSQQALGSPLVYVSGFFEQNRRDYYDLLYRVSTESAWIPWIKFFLAAVQTQATDALGRGSKLIELRDDYHQRVREKRASALLPKLIDELFLKPSFTIGRIRSLTGVTARAAAALIDKLMEKGILIEGTGRKAHRVFFAPEVLRIIHSK